MPMSWTKRRRIWRRRSSKSCESSRWVWRFQERTSLLLPRFAVSKFSIRLLFRSPQNMICRNLGDDVVLTNTFYWVVTCLLLGVYLISRAPYIRFMLMSFHAGFVSCLIYTVAVVKCRNTSETWSIFLLKHLTNFMYSGQELRTF